MAITPEWAAVVLTLMSMSGAAGTWIERRRNQLRSALPIVRAEWSAGSGGFTAYVQIVNRMDEDLRITEAACATTFITVAPTNYVAGNVEKQLTQTPSPMLVDWLVQARGERREEIVVVGGDAPRWLRFTMSSSASTLRSKRITIRESQRP
jgi:hypothetical protein